MCKFYVEADNRMNGRLHHQRKNVTTATAAANNYESLMGKVDCWDKEDDDVDGLYERNASNDRNNSSSNSNANSKISNNYHQQGYYPVKQDVVVVSTGGNREASSSLLKSSASGSAAIDPNLLKPYTVRIMNVAERYANMRLYITNFCLCFRRKCVCVCVCFRRSKFKYM